MNLIKLIFSKKYITSLNLSVHSTSSNNVNFDVIYHRICNRLQNFILEKLIKNLC